MRYSGVLRIQAPAGDKLHSIPIDKLMEVGGSAIHSCCSRASTDTDR